MKLTRTFLGSLNTCINTKEAWETFEVAHYRTSKMYMLKIQIFTTKFENLNMFEDETIDKSNVRICDISNNSFVLGEKMLE